MRGEIIELTCGSGPSWDAMSALDRRARDPRLVDAPRDLRAALTKLDVVIVGVGSVGMHMSRMTAQCGVRSLLLVDRARLKAQSFLTHPNHPRDLGRPKALVAGELAKALSPHTRVQAFFGDFAELSSDWVAGASVLLLAGDNLKSEVSVGERAIGLGVPLLQGSVHPATLTADVRVFAGGEGSPCPACSFQGAEWEAYDRGTVYSCAAEGETPPGAELPTQTPTASLPQLCSTAGDLTLLALTGLLAGVADPAASRALQFNAYTLRTTQTPLERNPDCPIDHTRRRVVACGPDFANKTPRELLREAGLERDDLRRVSLRVEKHRYAELASCRCTLHPELARFYGPGETPGLCPKCDTRRDFHPLHTHNELPLSVLTSQLDRPLAALGADTARAAVLRGAAGDVLFHCGRPDPGSTSNGERS